MALHRVWEVTCDGDGCGYWAFSDMSQGVDAQKEFLEAGWIEDSDDDGHLNFCCDGCRDDYFKELSEAANDPK